MADRVVNGTLGTFDPTLLFNDVYVIRLTAVDINGLEASAEILVNLEGNAKVGSFQLPAVDMHIPLAGDLAPTIEREYNTLLANESGNFGNGWDICALNPRIRETVAARPVFEQLVGMFASEPLKEGDKVYITTPDCKRVGLSSFPKSFPNSVSERFLRNSRSQTLFGNAFMETPFRVQPRVAH